MLECAITPGELAHFANAQKRTSAVAALVARCQELAASGVHLLVIREKELAAGELTHLVRVVVAATQASTLRVLVAERLDVALAAGAHGVHLSGADGSLTPAQVRRLLPQATVSVSCHSVEDVRTAVSHAADAVLLAPIFGKWAGAKQVTQALGLPILEEAARIAGRVPIFALGGVTRSNADACRDAGAAGIAGIRLFFSHS